MKNSLVILRSAESEVFPEVNCAVHVNDFPSSSKDPINVRLDSIL